MKYSGGILPNEFFTFLKVSAAIGFFAFVALIVAVEYKFFKMILGEELARKYRWVFVAVNIFLVLIVIFIFLVVFQSVSLNNL